MDISTALTVFKKTYVDDSQPMEGKAYSFRVSASNKVGEGQFSVPVQIIAAKGPEAPYDVFFDF